MAETYQLAIIGGGPAATAAGVYAARKRLKTVLVTKEFGGQSLVSPDIQNWIGTTSISGNDLASAFKKHLETYSNSALDIREGELVSAIEKKDNGFLLTTDRGSTYAARALLIAAGADRRKLPAKGAERFENKGLTYCASCDGPLFADQDVAVIGGGNAGFETAAQLLAYTKRVTLFQRGDRYNADEITVEKVLAHPNMTGVLNADITEVFGSEFVEGIRYTDTATGEAKELPVTGIFVEIGLIPNSGFLGSFVDLDEYKRIKIDPKNQQTSVEGVWAAGDITDVLYHQNNIAAGDAVRALEDIYLWLTTR